MGSEHMNYAELA